MAVRDISRQRPARPASTSGACGPCGGGTTSTGQGATCSSRCATLPTITPASAVCPRVPVTITSALSRVAASAITRRGAAGHRRVHLDGDVHVPASLRSWTCLRIFACSSSSSTWTGPAKRPAISSLMWTATMRPPESPGELAGERHRTVGRLGAVDSQHNGLEHGATSYQFGFTGDSVSHDAPAAASGSCADHTHGKPGALGHPRMRSPPGRAHRRCRLGVQALVGVDAGEVRAQVVARDLHRRPPPELGVDLRGGAPAADVGGQEPLAVAGQEQPAQTRAERLRRRPARRRRRRSSRRRRPPAVSRFRPA